MNTYFEKMRIKHLVKILVDEKYIGTKEYYKMKIKIMEEAMFIFYGSRQVDDKFIYSNFMKAKKEASRYIDEIITNEKLKKLPVIDEE